MTGRILLLMLLLVPVAAFAVDGHYAELPKNAPEVWGPKSARSLGRKVGDRITVDCPAGGHAAPVWGDGVYTDDSSVCAAAVHAGLIGFDEGGRIAIELAIGRGRYGGKLRNGVQSISAGGSDGSFFFPDALRFNPERTGKPMRIDWGNTASPWRGEVGRRMAFDCEPRGATFDADGVPILAPVFGTDVYRDDSSICASALHVGQITEAGGVVTIEIARADESFAATSRNGMSSRPAPRTGSGFLFPDAPPPARPVIAEPEIAAPTPTPVMLASVAPVPPRVTRKRSRPAPRIEWGPAPAPRAAFAETAPVPPIAVDASITMYSSLADRSLDRGFTPGFALAVRTSVSERVEVGGAAGWRKLSGQQPRNKRELGFPVAIDLVPLEAVARVDVVAGVGVQAGLGYEWARSRSKAGTDADASLAESLALSARRELLGGRLAASAGLRFGRHTFAGHDVETRRGTELGVSYERRF